MKKIVLSLITVLIFSAGAFAQGMGMGPGKLNRKAQERIDELEKIKLIETLNLDDEQMVKLLSRRKEFRDKTRQLMDLRDEKLDRLQKAFREEVKIEDKEYKKVAGELIELEEDISKVRLEYIRSLGEMLDSRQIVQLMVFERNFQREVRELLFKRRRGRMN